MINKVILLGNLGKDPDTRFTATGKAVTRFSLATSNTWVNGNGEKQQATEWHSVVVWGKQGEACSHYLQKGRQVYVEGELRHRSFDNKDGKEQHVNFLFLYMTAGIAACLAHAITKPRSAISLIGASGAISGVLGSFLITNPGARITH